MRNKEEKTMLEVIEPDYMAAFSCIGLLCPDTCCRGWDIVIDEATCERYEKSRNVEFKEMVSRAIVHQKEETNEGEKDIACIRMGKGKRCLFLCNDGLCMIQRKTEEKNLSETCRTYPRVIYIWNEEYAERSLCVSCPAVAKLILGRQEPLRFVTKKIEASELDGLRITDKDQRLETDCLPLRRFLIQVLQDRKLPLERRLNLANEFFWQAGGLSGHHAEKKFHNLVDIYQQKLEIDETIRPQDVSVVIDNTRIVQQLDGMRQLFFQRLQNPELRPSFRQQLEVVLSHWQFTDESSISQNSVKQYIEDKEFYQLFFLPKYSGLLENYLVNEVFKSIFITEDGAPFYVEWFRLIVQFVIVRALLMSALTEDPEALVQEHIIESIRQTSRIIGHDGLYLQQVMSQLSANQLEEAAVLQDFCNKLLGGTNLEIKEI